MSYFYVSVNLKTGDSTLSGEKIIKTMSISGLIGVLASMLLKTIYGDVWSIYTCLVLAAIVMLILFKETLSYAETMWIAHIFFASIIGLITLLFTIQPGLWSVFNNALLFNIAFSAIAVLGLVTIGRFIRELYERFRQFYPRKTTHS